ncbi:efflux transporter outer membrane subunit [Novosphingobium sp. FKTRR1]|uniref:efflux transporter outer membrane subunit n=1 Tax=Novosphingobium sp. FKTRR1 TaxID=2879118 RepID=UPI001CF02EAA|nr:efflux transporter outer membrane subunit [Novosphingobium sp. FKTRR1]
MTDTNLPRPRRAALVAALLPALMLGGCMTVGPDYRGAPVSAPAAAARGGFLRADAQTTSPVAPAPRWWESLADPVLSGLIDDALASSPDIAIASARITQARAGLAAQKTALVPTFNVSGVAPYINLPANLLGGSDGGRTETNIYSPALDASWEADLFGGTRRKVEAASARAEAADAGLADARVALSAEIARTYAALRARQSSSALLDRQAAIDTQLATLAEQRFNAGTAPEQPLDQVRAQQAQTAADQAKAKAEAQVLTDQLAVLTGKEPGALDSLLASPAPVPLPPAQVAIGDPASVLRQRPDIRRAERSLAAANADIGAKMADRFPKLTFTGFLGIGGSSLGDIFDPASIIGLALPQLKWNLFDAGRSAAQVRNARGAYAEAEAQYRKVVLGALQDAEGSLSRFGGMRIAYARALDSQNAAARSATLQQARAQGGTIGRSDSLAAERQQIQASLAVVSAQTDFTNAFIAVEKALGLGWETPAAPEGQLRK